MTIAAQQLLNSFDSLPDADKHEIVVEILRRVAVSGTDDLSDETLVATSELFSTLDAEEATNAQP